MYNWAVSFLCQEQNGMEYYSALKKKGVLTWATAWVTLGDIQSVLLLSVGVVHVGSSLWKTSGNWALMFCELFCVFVILE